MNFYDADILWSIDGSSQLPLSYSPCLPSVIYWR